MGRTVGMIETIGIATAIEAADVMMKTADVVVFQQNKTDPSLITIFIEGDVSAVKLAIEAGKRVAYRTGAFITCSVIPTADDQTVKCLMLER